MSQEQAAMSKVYQVQLARANAESKAGQRVTGDLASLLISARTDAELLTANLEDIKARLAVEQEQLAVRSEQLLKWQERCTEKSTHVEALLWKISDLLGEPLPREFLGEALVEHQAHMDAARIARNKAKFVKADVADAPDQEETQVEEKPEVTPVDEPVSKQRKDDPIQHASAKPAPVAAKTPDDKNDFPVKVKEKKA